jgi:two-component system, OmpR family, sensor histidine kinase SenX3
MDHDDNALEFKTYLASLAHDMKNSLSMLLNTTDEVLSRCVPESCPSYPLLSRLQYESKRVNNNLIQLLTLYKMDKAQLALNADYHILRDFIEDTINYNKPLLDSKGIHLEVDCPEDLASFFDRDLIGGVVNNILNNAFRYAKDTIKITAQKKIDDYLEIRIEDNGTGYPDHMFNMIPETPMKGSFSSGGTGLGLYFAYSVVKLHKNKNRTGYILINNTADSGGGCFSIFLP